MPKSFLNRLLYTVCSLSWVWVISPPTHPFLSSELLGSTKWKWIW